ncbi:methyltransferase domain-containing protein [Curvibacter sp. HBC61]|uniref:Methyltransferase domain-containing protein n=1 Tax=Curvibacter cyanobacteriorum TaxID=3026422 RepID=A0ABT5N3F7_9BURK|nr:methyltransferase domain-containing protein [Curvibacter sp. HBC61]MDD0840114.1 methyltransferase domain-containing protein [Curvibacter sp. HBC61]
MSPADQPAREPHPRPEAPDAARPCPVCAQPGALALKTLSLPQPSGSPLPAGYRLMACTACDLVFADTPAPQSAYDLYYQHCAKYGGPTGTGAGLHSADQARLDQMADRLLAWRPQPQARVLDLGCGAGGLLSALMARGLQQVEGLDPDPSAVQAARARGLRLREGLIHEATTHCAGERYDLIVLSHVAEHLRDLHSLPALARLLAPQGRLYIEVPHPGGYACGERPPYYYFDSEHINHFSAQALARLLAPAGLQLLSTEAVQLPLAGGSHYPALAVVAGFGDDPRAGAALSPQPATVASVQRYLADCARGARLVPQPPLPPTGPVLAWGAGSWAQRLLGQDQLPRERLRAFLDKDPNKQGLQLGGLPILPPEQGLRDHPGAAILVCVAIDPQQVAADLDALAPGARQRLHFLSDPT